MSTSCNGCGEPSNFQCIYSSSFKGNFCCAECRDGFKESLLTLDAKPGGGGKGGGGGGNYGGSGGRWGRGKGGVNHGTSKGNPRNDGSVSPRGVNLPGGGGAYQRGDGSLSPRPGALVAGGGGGGGGGDAYRRSGSLSPRGTRGSFDIIGGGGGGISIGGGGISIFGGGGRRMRRPVARNLYGPRVRGSFGGIEFYNRYGGRNFRNQWGSRYSWAPRYYDYPSYHPFWYLLSKYPVGHPFWDTFGYYPMNDPYWNQYGYYGEGGGGAGIHVGIGGGDPYYRPGYGAEADVVVFEKKTPSLGVGHLLTSGKLFSYPLEKVDKDASLGQKMGIAKEIASFATINNEEKWLGMSSLLFNVCSDEETFSASTTSHLGGPFTGYIEGKACSLVINDSFHSKERELQCLALQHHIQSVINKPALFGANETLLSADILLKQSSFDYNGKDYTEKGHFLSNQGKLFSYECERDLPLHEQVLFAKLQMPTFTVSTKEMAQLQSQITQLSTGSTLDQEMTSSDSLSTQGLLIGYKEDPVVIYGKGVFNYTHSQSETANSLQSLYDKIVSSCY